MTGSTEIDSFILVLGILSLGEFGHNLVGISKHR